jgi:hypothetical protein
MKFNDRIAAFEKLGNYINAIDEAGFTEISLRARNENAWFTEESVKLSLSGIAGFLNGDSLRQWTSRYNLTSEKNPKTVALVMAGNIPLVGFHDLLCVLISGHRLMIKPSAKDKFLLRLIVDQLIAIEPRFSERISTVERLKDFDAVIATGSDNSARYFEYYFSKYPHIIRKNRSSCAILTGFETDEELQTLGKDVFSYFGLGCRNVSKLYVPKEYEFPRLLKNWEGFDGVLLHHKYHNNYDYQKSILLVNRVPFLDSGFVLVQESTKLVSPISVIYYEYYNEWSDLLVRLKEDASKIQCVIGNAKPATVKIGSAQSPNLDDYADHIDTLKFLETL